MKRLSVSAQSQRLVYDSLASKTSSEDDRKLGDARRKRELLMKAAQRISLKIVPPQTVQEIIICVQRGRTTATFCPELLVLELCVSEHKCSMRYARVMSERLSV